MTLGARRAAALAAGLAGLACGAAPASAGTATCSDVMPGFHFPNGFAPGASFCNSRSSSPGFHF